MWQRVGQSLCEPRDRRGERLRTKSLPTDELRRQFFRRGKVEEDEVGDAAIEVHRSQKLARLDAVLLIAESAMSPRRLAQLAMLASPSEATLLVERLNRIYDAGETAVHVEQVATGFQLLTLPKFAHWLDRLHNRQVKLKLSTQALETLSIVAYRQPITRADIKAIRGVDPVDTLKLLMDRGLVRLGGYDDALGRPYLYETTPRFLELFGLRDLADLPNAEALRRPPRLPVHEDRGVGPELEEIDEDAEFDDEFGEELAGELEEELAGEFEEELEE